MRFRYKGTDPEGRPVSGETSADSPEQATRLLEKQGIRVSELRPKGRRALGPFFSRPDRAEVAAFCQQLARLADSGLPLPQALKTVATDASSGRLRSAVQRVTDGVKEGRDLATLLKEEKGVFPPLLAAVVAVGQRTGDLPEALRLAATHMWRMRTLRNRVRNAVAYPAVVFLLLCIIGSGVFIHVVPYFTRLYVELDIELHGPARAIMFLSKNFPTVAASALALILLIFVMFRYVNHPEAWVRLRRWIAFRFPLYGRVLRAAFLCRFSRMASLMLSAGCPADQMLDLLGELEKDPASPSGLGSMGEAVRGGKSVSDALRARMHVFPEALVWMVQTCEDTGRLPQGFSEAADLYRQETERNTELINAVLPGVAVLVVGAPIGLTVAAVFAPLVTLMRSLS